MADSSQSSQLGEALAASVQVPMRLFLIPSLLLVALPFQPVYGQERRPSNRLEATVQASYIPLYRGDATVGSYSGLGPTFRMGFRSGGTGRHMLELFYTRTPGNDYNAKPRLSTWGGLVGAGIGDPLKSVAGLVAIGIGRLSIEAKEFDDCLPPTCFAEGGGNYHDAQLTTLVGDAGLTVGLSSSLALRSDLRLHWPLDAPAGVGSSGNLRVEAAVGLTWSWPGGGPSN